MNNQRDRLTGLYNRGYGMAQLERAVAEAKQRGETAAVLFADIEHFSDLNCSLGHEAGDLVLCQSAQRFEGIVGDKVTVCRFCTDEFFVVLPSASGAEARMVAQQIREQLAKQPLNVNQHVVQITLTIGVAFYPDNGQDAESLLRVAEEAAPPTKWCRRAREAGEASRLND